MKLKTTRTLEKTNGTLYTLRNFAYVFNYLQANTFDEKRYNGISLKPKKQNLILASTYKILINRGNIGEWQQTLQN